MLESIKVPFEECKEELMKSGFIASFYYYLQFVKISGLMEMYRHQA